MVQPRRSSHWNVVFPNRRRQTNHTFDCCTGKIVPVDQWIFVTHSICSAYDEAADSIFTGRDTVRVDSSGRLLLSALSYIKIINYQNSKRCRKRWTKKENMRKDRELPLGLQILLVLLRNHIQHVIIAENQKPLLASSCTFFATSSSSSSACSAYEHQSSWT